MKIMFGINYIALSGLHYYAFLSAGLCPTFTNYIPSGFKIIFKDEPNKAFGRLLLRSDLNSIETVLQTTVAELEEVRKEIKTRYSNG